jgi:hypothetical protein
MCRAALPASQNKVGDYKARDNNADHIAGPAGVGSRRPDTAGEVVIWRPLPVDVRADNREDDQALKQVGHAARSSSPRMG